MDLSALYASGGLVPRTTNYTTGIDGTVPTYGDTPSVNFLNDGGQAYQDSLQSGYPTGGGGTTPSYTQGVNDPGTLAQYDQSIGLTNTALGRLGTQLNSGNQGIDTAYTDALNQLLLNKNQGQTAYNSSKLSNSQNYVKAKNTVGVNAGNNLSGLLRLLGARGAGGSSAALISAPGAVARQATQQRAGIGQDFAQNLQGLDTNWNNFLTGYNNQVSSAGSQKDRQKQQLQQSIDTNRSSLLQSLATLNSQKAAATGGNPSAAAQPYLDQANSVLDRLANYSVAPINYQTQAYNAPSLASYTTTNQTPTYQGQSAPNDYYSPYLQALLGKKQIA